MDAEEWKDEDYWHECSKLLNNKLEVWIDHVRSYYGVELSEAEARRDRAGVRGKEDRGDRFHPLLRNDEPWF